ncbi:MAG: AbrB/MazE/SpoVT family DNA-binding domain-containing protein [Clostridia bacterium]|nr:AbrB/MazE/SpoVT family DNA-binding domain-containing protein [Clostridia bacterium]MBR6008745.1 AbrB/MazE/SpoVT family DNA-binding domain-containing protein [Clostridia bacterium]MBR6499016.1 AbrB/MazE/SpoVT family DNA-binding domain-containing protein [Clostridia bacterium]
MQLQLKPWGNSTGIRFSKEFLERAGISQNDTLNAEIVDGRIILTPAFAHRSLKERAAEFGGELRLSDEMPREEAVGSEVW